MMDSGDKLFQVVKFASKPGFRELIQKEIVFIEIPVADSDSFRIPGKRLICLFYCNMISQNSDACIDSKLKPFESS
jgi:hypothetical protein